MANFQSAIAFVLSNEGGLSENTSDTGGITNFGISFEFLKEIPENRLKQYGILDEVTEQTIRDLTRDQAISIYNGEFWGVVPFEKIQNQMLANYIFDMAVNMGISQAIKLTQRAVWACQKKKDFITDDGLLGAKTIQAINHCSFMLLVGLAAQRDGFYRQLVALNPKREGELNGWLNRCYRN